MYTFGDSPLEADMNLSIGDTLEIPTLAQTPKEWLLGLNAVIDPELMQNFLFGAKLPNQSSPSALPEPFFQQVATGGWPLTVDKTITVQYDTIDEAKQALLEARKKTLQKLQFITQQIESLEKRKRKRNESFGDLESMGSSFI